MLSVFIAFRHRDIGSLFFGQTLSYGKGASHRLDKQSTERIFFIFLGSKNKEREQKVKFCTNELKEIKDLTNDVIQAVKSCKKSKTEDPGSMKLVLKELQLALGTFLSSTAPTS